MSGATGLNPFPNGLQPDSWAPLHNHAPQVGGVGAAPLCDPCGGFMYRQREPGWWVVCESCCGSGLATIKGDMVPGATVRNTRREGRPTVYERQGTSNSKNRRTAA